MSTLKARVAALMAEGHGQKAVARVLEKSPAHIGRIMWALRNPEAAKEKRRAYDRSRYGTEKYRKMDREYKRNRYRSDPAYRERVKAAVKASKARTAEKAS